MKQFQSTCFISAAIFCLLINLHCGSSKLGGSGGKYKYDAFHSADFPAFVETIQFSSGAALSANSPVKWGNWTVSFPKNNLPTATSGGGGDITVTGLIASNPVQGDFPCMFSACKACAYTGDQADRREFIRRCRLLIGSEAIPDKDYTKRTFGTTIVIDCPVDVRLKQ